jgi:hypothetical protein
MAVETQEKAPCGGYPGRLRKVAAQLERAPGALRVCPGRPLAPVLWGEGRGVSGRRCAQWDRP